MQKVLMHHSFLNKMINLKSEFDKLDIDKLSELDADKLKPVPTDLSKLSNVVKMVLIKIKIIMLR